MTVEAKIAVLDFLDFFEFKALRAQKNYITFYIYLRAICGRKERKNDFPTSAAKFKFYLIFGDICSEFPPVRVLLPVVFHREASLVSFSS